MVENAYDKLSQFYRINKDSRVQQNLQHLWEQAKVWLHFVLCTGRGYTIICKDLTHEAMDLFLNNGGNNF